MSTVILACTSLSTAVRAAQEKMHTDYPIIYLDQLYHRSPKEMQEHVCSELAKLPSEVDTILVAMGFCGGSWQDVISPCRVVLPRVDDCVSLMLTTDDQYRFNRKQAGHIYIISRNTRTFSPSAIYRNLLDEYKDEDMAEAIFDLWFENYHYLDLVETGLYDCYEESFINAMQRDADMFEADLLYRPGSNRILEKLVSSQWDDQFVVVDPACRISQGTLLEKTMYPVEEKPTAPIDEK